MTCRSSSEGDLVKIFGPLIVAILLLAPAIRLSNQARRTRQTPEIWAALYFLGAGVGIPLRLYGSSIFETNPDLASTINIVGHLFFAAGASAMTVFTWRVFHPSNSHARLFGMATIAGIFATTFYTLAYGFASTERSSAMIMTNFARLVPTYWAFYESLRYWGAMRKRIPLGLADPVVANRFLLWAIWTGAVSVLPTVALSLRLLDMLLSSLGPAPEMGEFSEAVFFLLRLVFLTVAPIAAVALSLSFFPPSGYLDRVRARADAPAAAS
jgi:hypothetical protein